MAKFSEKYIILAQALPFMRKLIALFSAVLLLMQAVKPMAARAASMERTVEQYIAAESAPPEPEPELPQDVQTVLLAVCESRGYGEECGKTLLGMLWKESLNNPKAVGDRGKSHGYFQIQTKLHKVSLECAEDLRCSAEWSLDYLERNGYPRYARYAVQCHNGCNAGNGYAASALRHGNRLWSQPMPIASGAGKGVAVR